MYLHFDLPMETQAHSVLLPLYCYQQCCTVVFKLFKKPAPDGTSVDCSTGQMCRHCFDLNSVNSWVNTAPAKPVSLVPLCATFIAPLIIMFLFDRAVCEPINAASSAALLMLGLQAVIAMLMIVSNPLCTLEL